MTTKTIDCIECGASVPYGRLSCTACGALLASMTGGRPAVELGSPPTPEPAVSSDPEWVETLDAPGPAEAAEPAAPEPPEPSVLLEPLEVVPPPATFLLPDEPATFLLPDEPVPVLAGRPYTRHPIGDAWDGPTRVTPHPGADRPPALMLSGAVAAGPGWPEPAAASHPSHTAEPGMTTVRSRLGPLDPVRLAETAGWFVIVGATMAVLGFLLPWSAVVIGARSAGSYFDMWGLASPTHVVVLATTMLVLALAILQTPVPVWVRSGVLPLALGSLLIGLVWPYQVGPLGADVGILVVALGALALVVGGVVATWATRHVELEPAV